MADFSKYPKSNVTFVFTDIEGSTPTTKRLGDRPYAEKLRDPHRVRLLKIAGEHHGFEIFRAGDGHLLVFDLADDALACVAAFQRSLEAEPIAFEGTTLKVRVGVHTARVQGVPRPMALGHAEVTGEIPPEAIVPEYSCSGEVNFAARVGSLGYGRQILVSASTKEKAKSFPSYRSHPWPGRRLKGFEGEGHEVFEIIYLEGQTPSEPGVRLMPDFDRDDKKNRYIVRPEKEREVADHFSPRPDGSTARLVTIWAGGGMGKSRLAVACALQMLDLFDGRIHFVSLAFVAPQVDAVAEAIGRAFGWIGEAAHPDALFEALRERPKTLILLDNFESVADPAVSSYLSKLAVRTDGVSLLVTGRTRVGVSDVERYISLSEGMTPGEARALFLARSQTDETIGHINDVLFDRLLELTDRIPLALELAAAWRKHQELEEIVAGLEDTPLLERPPGEIPSDSEETRKRHETLERSLYWSYNLLGRFEGEAVQRLFAVSGLFVATFDASTLAAVSGETSAKKNALRLYNASLFRREPIDGSTRYRLHRSTREFARARLSEYLAVDVIFGRFVDHYMSVILENHNKLNDQHCLALLEREWQNAIAAAGAAEVLPNHQAVMVISMLGDFLSSRGLWSEQEKLCHLVHSQATCCVIGSSRSHS